MEAVGISAGVFRARIVEPALGKLALPGGEAAIRLVLGTCVHESQGLTKIVQDGGGPALGFPQIEPPTLADLDENFLAFRPELSAALDQLVAPWPTPALQLATNPLFAVAVCRLVYYRAPAPLPDAADLDGLGKYWKRFYNTDEGAGTVAEFVSDYRRYIGGAS